MTILERIAPRLAKAHHARRIELLRRRPCGRDGWCCACYIADDRRNGRIARERYEATPWQYDKTDRRFARHPYTLLVYHGGFMTRLYDWALEHRPLNAR